MRTCATCATNTDEPGQYCPECGAALPETTAPDAVNPAASLIGTSVDGFEILGILGGGAFGTVYRGRQIALDRPVALKVPTAEIATDPVMAKRFAREARSAAKINHPGVVGIYAVGELVDKRPYLAMQLVDGQPLDKILADGPIDPLRACRLARLIASALAETHAADVVHRDLKPTNIMWRTDRHGDDRITIVDFGIAASKPGNADATRLTSGGLIGTPHYMSPEQAHGEQVDARADLYALGCLMYELVTGATPFEGSGFEVLLAHLGRPIPTPSAKNPAVPAHLDRLIKQLMAKKAEHRPASADEVVKLLDEAIVEIETRAPDADPHATVASAPRARRRTEVSGDIATATTATAVPRPAPRRNRALMFSIAGVLGLSAAALAAIKLTANDDAAASTTTEEADFDPTRPSAFTGLRTVVVDDGEMAARATLHDPIVAGKRTWTTLEVWNAIGAPLDVDHLVLTIEAPDGTATGVTAQPSKRATGRYGLPHIFETPGHYVLRVFPPEAATVFTIDLDVEPGG
ncbi:MAG: serine/threonine-protein kinase [Kofleriaceae bacterium]|nr:serine/threonine-protein kinase [Kofleriaceae bacterium]